MSGLPGRFVGLLMLLALGACGGSNAPPEHDRAISAGKPFLHKVDALVESDGSVEYTATLADGRALPEWLSFDPASRTFRGVAPDHLPPGSTVRVQVVATGASSTLAKTSFGLVVIAAAADVPMIVNPAEELVEFDPKGLLRWSAVAGADAYEVWAYRDADLTQVQEFSGALDSRQYQFTKLVGGQTYFIKMYFRASGVWKEVPTFSITTATQVLKARLSNSQEELEGFGATGTLRWSAVTGADMYEVWVYRDAALEAFAESSGVVRITQYQISTLTPGTTYYVVVFARVNGVFYAGGALPITITSQQDKARIVNPQEELDAFATNGRLRWTPVTGATAYELWIFTNPNVSEIYESSGSLTTRSYAARTLQPGTVYYAQAFALVNGQWQVGAPVKITTTGQVTTARLTTAQEELEAFSTTGTLRWTEVPGATAYELWVYAGAGLGTIIESGANADRSYQPTKLCSGATYYVQVYALVNGVWTTGWATRLDVTQGTSASDCVPPAPQITLTASPFEVFSGENVTLTWSSKFATSCTASGAWAGPKALSGQEAIGPITGKSLFTLTCIGQSGAYRAETLVTVVPAIASLAGKILVPANAQVDSDLNDPVAPYRFNDTFSAAQALPNPALLGGYINERFEGPSGESYYYGDYDDFYRVSLVAGQLIELVVSDADPLDPEGIRNDVDLELYSMAGVLLDGAYGVGMVERLYAPSSGDFYVRVEIYNGASTYTLSIGDAPQAQTALTGALTLSDEFAAGEVVVRLRAGGSSDAGQRQKAAIDVAATHGLARLRGDPGREVVYGVRDRTASLGSAKVAAEDLPDGLRFESEAQRQKRRTLHAVKRLLSDPDVQFASPNWIFRASVRPDDPFYPYQRWHYEMINLPAAWDVTRGSSDVTVAVVDTGIRPEHPEFAGRLADGYDFVFSPLSSGDGDGFDADPTDPGQSTGSGALGFHGTHVAGTVGAIGNNGLGVTGVAWNVRIMPVRVLGVDGSGTLSDVLDGIRYAAGLPNSSGRLPTRRADVINLSLGGARACTAAEQAVLSDVRAAGVVVVAAAGNEQLSFAGAPASCGGVIAVSAVDSSKGRAWYSNYGTGVDIAAPGGNVSTDIDGVAGPDGVFSTFAQKFGASYQPFYVALNGTSMASPHVAGVIALMKSVRSTLLPAEVDALIQAGSITDDIGVPGPDGLGQGLVNASKAVRAASSAPPAPGPVPAVAPTALSFSAATSAAELRVSNAGSGTLFVTGITTTSNRIRVVATSVDANGLGSYVVTVDRVGIAPGNYTGAVTVQTSAGPLVVQMLINVAAAQVMPDAGTHYVLLVDAATFDAEEQVVVETRGGEVEFRFDGVRAGIYYLIAGTDMNNDGYICDAGEACAEYPVYGDAAPVRLRGSMTGFELRTGFHSALFDKGSIANSLGHQSFEKGYPRMEGSSRQ